MPELIWAREYYASGERIAPLLLALRSATESTPCPGGAPVGERLRALPSGCGYAARSSGPRSQEPGAGVIT
jgi:hypothetical protein